MAMVDMETVMAKVVEYLETKDYDIVQTVDDVVVCEYEDCIVICRVRYMNDEYGQDPTREECERVMCSVLMDTNLDKTGPVRFDDIQVLDFGNGHALIRHHTNAAGNQEN